MFDVLLSSGVPRWSGRSRGVAAAAFHLMVIAGAIRVTAQDLPVPAQPHAIETIFISPHRPAPLHRSVAGGGIVSSAPEIVLPPPPSDMPTFLPPIVLGPSLDPARLRIAVLSGLPPGGPGDPATQGGAPTKQEVDEPARVVSQPSPRYPPVLQQARVEGRVVVEFVIDTLGHLEAGSLRIVGSSNRGFEAAAIAALEHSVFLPARVRGRPDPS
jgi:protein TonB